MSSYRTEHRMLKPFRRPFIGFPVADLFSQRPPKPTCRRSHYLARRGASLGPRSRSVSFWNPGPEEEEEVAVFAVCRYEQPERLPSGTERTWTACPCVSVCTRVCGCSVERRAEPTGIVPGHTVPLLPPLPSNIELIL